MQIKLFKPINNTKVYLGKLKNYNENEIILEIQNEEKIFERKNISQIKTIFNW